MSTRPPSGLGAARQIQGKELSYNNLNDTDAAYALVAEFDRPAIVIVKHANPCGVAVAADLRAAWDRALACDPVSAYGGIVAVNRAIDVALAQALAKISPRWSSRPDRAGRDADPGAEKTVRLLLAGGCLSPTRAGA